MDRRTLLALVLTAMVIVVTPILFPGPRRPQPVADSVGVSSDSVRATQPTAAQPTAASPAAPAPATSRSTQRSVGAAAPALPQVRAETTIVNTDHVTHRIASIGGTPVGITLPAYRSLRPGSPKEMPVSLLETGDRLLHLRLAGDADTIALDTIRFRASPQRREARGIVQTFVSENATPAITLTYHFPLDSFVTRIEGSIAAPTGTRRLLVTMPTRIRSEEADIMDDTRHLAVAFKTGPSEVENVSFRDLDTLQTRVDTGAIRWIAERNKYFVVAAIPAGRDSNFRAVILRGGPQVGPEPTAVHATGLLPLTSNTFALRIYAGPQSWDHLRKTAVQLENVNPYGGWLHGLVQPFATIVMRMILWMRHTFNVSYGWVLVIFGVLVRIVLWPLNQNAMRSSMKLQRIQPQLAELQKKYKENPEKQREAMMKLYQEHGMSPFTPILGCLPMLLPMPILFALYFVFQNTIELRGVPFLWLPDLALKDPYYIIPLLMGISMFVLSWIGMRGMPPSPQTKMMSYVMPVMFTVLFWNFASGLNLYYAVQNLAALPQQWLLARERTGGGGKSGAMAGGGSGGGGSPVVGASNKTVKRT
jgi:YidC/Oxa1 family membrane protein insertase